MFRVLFSLIVVSMCPFLDAHAQVTTKITGAKLSHAVITSAGMPDPCAGMSVGDTCANGGVYAGTGFAGLGSFRYMSTPSNCNNASPTPTCDGGTDWLYKFWANNSGTTAAGVNTGAVSATDGPSNTLTLAVNYTDTEAAKYCENMIYPAGGYTDWYLPSIDELHLVFGAMAAAGEGNFNNSTYLSSTEADADNCRCRNFPTGSPYNCDKTVIDHIRCIRRY